MDDDWFYPLTTNLGLGKSLNPWGDFYTNWIFDSRKVDWWDSFDLRTGVTYTSGNLFSLKNVTDEKFAVDYTWKIITYPWTFESQVVDWASAVGFFK